MKHNTKPNWWVPFSFVPLMIVAILLESHLSYPTAVHEIADSGIVIATFSLMVGWVHLNADKLSEEDYAKERWIFTEEPSDGDDDEDNEIDFSNDLIPEPTHEPLTQPAHTAIGLRDIDTNKGRYN